MTKIWSNKSSVKATGRALRSVKIGLAASIVALSLGAQAQAQGVPVYDNAAFLQWGKQLIEMKNQLDQAKAIFDEAQKLNQSFDFSQLEQLKTLLDDKNFQQYLPQEYGKVASAVDGMLKGNVDGFAEQYDYYESKGQTNANDFYQNELKRKKGETYKDMAVGEVVYDQASKRLDGLNELREKISSTQSPREVMELQARIQAESAILQNEVLRMQGVAMIQEARNRVDEQRVEERRAERRDQMKAAIGSTN
ncbi:MULTISPECIES: type IV secretion system protein [Agrobacterium]|jgi:type IV secretion system protein VirB5|uniref:Type IV secretion system protein n=3 Tax=Agrobacterium TaxID=357 RepID=A0AA44EHB1_9HYPH|nr:MULTISPECIES: type IV secretion system protein [Agrobacterium]PZU78332.1 MAG: P-type DNA transfer protein VirB5 [Rhizobium sp.]MDX8311707.1 type IV secretion system protein [Agrobacterium sp. rho-13.3]MDX8332685.1 type IV secretion system protein [Agrobacterium rosae]NRF07700.1 type IV secretion system protein [Agrobacterium pusense]NRF18072.1 type IV secretion system protein [Agrobacterium pusense]